MDSSEVETRRDFVIVLSNFLQLPFILLQIYMSASKISNLQSKIKNLEQEVKSTRGGDKRTISELEEDIAESVAQTCRSEHDVSHIRNQYIFYAPTTKSRGAY